MTEITVKIRWPFLILAILLGPALANTVLIMASVIFLPLMPLAFLFGVFSLPLGYLSYLILAGPLMIAAQVFGFRHPLFHAAIGYGAVCLIPPAHAAGLPFIAGPDIVEFGQWFGPAWCFAAAAFYPFLGDEFAEPDEVYP